MKFSHSKSEQKSKLNFAAKTSDQKRKPLPNPQGAPPNEEKQEEPVAKKAKTRVRFRNYKKLELAREFQGLREAKPTCYKDEWDMSHPTVSIRTVERWIKPDNMKQIEHDALHANPKVRDAFVSSKRLEFLKSGRFPRT